MREKTDQANQEQPPRDVPPRERESEQRGTARERADPRPDNQRTPGEQGDHRGGGLQGA